MKNIRFCFENLFDIATILVSSEAEDFPKENLKHYWVVRYWRSMSALGQWIKADFGESKSIKAFIAKYHNITQTATIKIQANSVDSWENPPLNQDVLRNDDYLVYIWESGQNYRYWRLYINDPDNADGFIKIGRIFLGDYFEPAINFDYKKPIRLRDESQLISSFSGQVAAVEKPKFQEHAYSFILSSSDISSLKTIWETVGITVPYFIIEDADSAPDKIYYVRNINEWELRPLTPSWSYYEIEIQVREER
jgi:hypothetical protein